MSVYSVQKFQNNIVWILIYNFGWIFTYQFWIKANKNSDFKTKYHTISSITMASLLGFSLPCMIMKISTHTKPIGAFSKFAVNGTTRFLYKQHQAEIGKKSSKSYATIWGWTYYLRTTRFLPLHHYPKITGHILKDLQKSF